MRGFEPRPGQRCALVSPDAETLEAQARLLLSGARPAGGSPQRGMAHRTRVAAAWPRETLFGELTARDHLALDPPRSAVRLGIVRKGFLSGLSQAAATQLGGAVDWDRPVRSLDANARAILALLLALQSPRPVMLLWRIARHLSVDQFEKMGEALRREKLAGRAVLYIPDRVEEIPLVADRLWLLQGNAPTEVGDFEKLSLADLGKLVQPSESLGILALHDPIHRARKLLFEQREGASVSFENLAAAVGLSYDFFRKEFKRRTGASPKQYLLALKMDRAKEQLLYSDESAERIAERLGFTDGSHFAKLFQKRERMTPLEFRRQTGRKSAT